MDELIQVRKEITRIQNENAKLTTRIVRNEKIILQKEETLKLVQTIANEEDDYESDSTQASFKIKSLPSGMNKVRELYKTLCQCGSQAQFNGFCQQCLEKMKNEYEKALNDYRPITIQYEKLYTDNVNRGVKIQVIKQKIKSMIEKKDDISYDNELKLLYAEIDYLKQQIKVTNLDYELQQKEFDRFLKEQNKIQDDLEVRVAKKTNKLEILKEQISEQEEKIRTIQDSIEIAKEEINSYLK